MNIIAQTHKIRATVSIKKVNITVRFPCSLSFNLKNDSNNQIIESKSLYQLSKGQSLVNEEVQLQLDVPFSNGQYEQAKMTLTIFMVSTNGKIPAGSILLNPTTNIRVQKRIPLEKCPDRNAGVILTQTFEKISVIKTAINNAKNSNLFIQDKKQLRASNFFQSKNNSLSSSNYKYSKISNSGSMLQQGKIVSAREQRSSSKDYQSKYPLGESKFRLITVQNKDRSTSKQIRIPYRERSKKQFFGKQQMQKSIEVDRLKESRGSRSSSNQFLYQNKQQERMAQQIKILKLQKEKGEYIRQINKLKTQMTGSNQQQIWILEDQLNRVKNQNQNLNQEIDKFKDQIKLLQRKDKDQTNIIKQFKQEIQKKRIKINQLQSTRLKDDQILMKKDKTIRDLHSQVKKLNERIQQLKSQDQANIKRNDFKENSLKQQIKKITQKYAQSETQRQKYHLDFTNLQNQIQNLQRKNTLTLKEREKTYLDQKSRLAKKIEQLSLTLQKKVEQLQYHKLNREEVSSTQILLSKKENESNEMITSLQGQLEAQIRKKNELQQKSKSLQSELEQAKSSMIEQKDKNKKKNNQTINELQKLKEKLQKSESLCLDLQKKKQDLQNLLNTKASEKMSLDTKWTQLKKEHESLKKQENQRQRLAQTLSVQNYSSNQKIVELKDRLQRERVKYDQLQTQYQNQVNYFTQSKQYLEIQVKDLKQYIEKEQSKILFYQDKLKKHNDTILDLNQQIMSLLQNQRRYQQQIKDLTYTNSTYLTELQNFNSKLKSLKQQLQTKNQQNYLINKRIKDLQQGNSLIQQKIYSQSLNYKQNQTLLSSKLVQKQNRLNQALQTIQSLKSQAEQSKQETFILKKQNNQFKIELQYKVNEIRQKEDAIQKLSISCNQLQKQLYQKQMMITSNAQQLKTTQIQTLNFQRLYNQLKLVFQNYKTQTEAALQELLNYISNNQQVILAFKGSPSKNKQIKMSLKSFPSSDLSQLQIQCLTKRNQTIVMYKSRIQQLQNKLQIQNNQIQKSKVYETEREQEFQQQLFLERQKANNLLSQKQQQMNQLQRQVHSLQNQLLQANGQVQHLNQTIIQLQEVSQQIGEQLRNCQKQRNILQTDNKYLQIQIQKLKQIQIKSKNSYEQNFRQTVDQAQNTINILKSSNVQLNQKLVKYEQINTQQQQVIKNLQVRIAELQQINKTYQTTFQLQSNKIKTLNMTQTEKDKIISHKLKQITQLTTKIQQCQKQMQIEKLKFERLSYQHKKLLLQLEAAQVLRKNVQSEFQSMSIDYKAISSSLLNNQAKLIQLQQIYSKNQKQLKEKIQLITSDLQLKIFLLSQLQNKQKQSNYLVNLKNQQTIQKSQEIKQMKLRLNFLQNQNISLSQQNIHLKNQIQFHSSTIQRIKKQNSQIQNQINHLRIQQETSIMRQKEVIQLREEIQVKENHFQKTYADLRNSINESKKDLANRTTKEQEQRKKIRELQKLIQDKNFDLVAEKNKWLGDSQRQKRQLNQKINQLQKKIQTLKQEFDFQKDQLQAEIHQNIEECSHLSQTVKEKQSLIGNYEQHIQKNEILIANLQNKLSLSLTQWERQKSTYHPTDKKVKQLSKQLSKFDKFSKQIDSRSKQLIQIAKRKVHEENPQGISQILRQIAILTMRTKAKVISKCNNQKDKQSIISDYRILQQKLELAMKSNGVIKPMGFH